jgi:hypothetical protein
VLGSETSASLLKTLDASEVDSAVTIDVGSVTSIFSVIGGTQDDTIKLTSENLSRNLSVDGGNGTDNVIIEDRADIVDLDLINFSNVETLTLSDYNNQEIVLGANASDTGLLTIDASALGSDSNIDIDIADFDVTGNITVTGGNGDDTVTISMLNIDALDTIDLGDGDDILIIDDNLATLGSTFEAWVNGGGGDGLANIETIKLSNYVNQTLLLGAESGNLGLNNIDLSGVSQAVTIDATDLGTGLTVTTGNLGNHVITTADNSSADYDDVITTGIGINTVNLFGGDDNVNLGGGNDTISIAASDLTSADVLNGGIGDDTLVINTAGTIGDDQFTNVSFMEILKLDDDTAQSITIGAEAVESGLEEIIVNDTATFSNAVTIDASAFTENIEINTGTGNDVITAGQGVDRYELGDGDDTITYSNNYLTNTDVIFGGDGTDTLIINPTASSDPDTPSVVNITDNQFFNIRSVETVKLGENISGQEITLGGVAQRSGLETLDLTGIDGANYTIDTTAFNGDLTIVKDTVGGTFRTSNFDDTITFQDSSFDDSTEFIGSGGTDTIKIDYAATTTSAITDGDFASLTSVEEIALEHGGDVALDEFAESAGIEFIDLTNSDATSNIDATLFENSITVSVGDSTDNINKEQDTEVNDFVYSVDGDDLIGDTIDLGRGNSDALVFNEGVTLDATHLHAGLSEIEILKLGNSGDFDIDLSVSTIADRISVDPTSEFIVDGSSMRIGQSSEINITDRTDTISVQMGAGSDTVKMELADFLLYSDETEATNQRNLDGGSGVDTLLITDAANITDAHFDDPDQDLLGTTKINGFETLGLGAGGTVVLGRNATAERISTIDASSSSAASDINMASVYINSTVYLGDNAGDKVTAGRYNDTVIMEAAFLDATDEIELGLGEDTLHITTDATFTVDGDTSGMVDVFDGLLNVEILKLSGSGASEVIMTGTSFEELDGRSMTTGSITVDMTDQTTTTEVKLGAGDDTVKMEVADLTAIDKNINAGLGNDTLWITDTGGSYTDADFASRSISAFETIKLEGSLTGGSNFFATGIDTIEATAALTSLDLSGVNRAFEVTGSSGNDTIVLGDRNNIVNGVEGTDNITTGTGLDTFNFEGDQLAAADTVNGGDGIDTINFTSTIGTLADTAFTNVTNVEKIVIGDYDAQNITFGTEMYNSGNGVTTIDARAIDDGAFNFTLQKSVASATLRFDGGDANDTVKILTNSDFLLATDALDGNGGTNILEFATNATLSNAQLSLVRDFDEIKLGTGTTNNLTLAGNFQTAGITTIDASVAATNTIDMSGVTLTQNYVIDGGTAVDTVTARSLVVENGITYDGNGGSLDVLEISDRALLSDSAFTNIDEVEILTLSNFITNTLEIGDEAKDADFIKIDGSAITTGSAVIDFSSMSSAYGSTFTVDVSNATSVNTITIQANQLSSNYDITVGSNTADKLILTNDGGTTPGESVADAAFTNLAGFERLELDGGDNYTIELGTNANSTGIDYIDGRDLGSNTLTLDGSSFGGALEVYTSTGDDDITTDSGAYNDRIEVGNGTNTVTSGGGDDFINGGTGNDTFKFLDADLTSADRINGLSGTDTLVITDAADLTLTDTALLFVNGMERLEVEGGGLVTFNATMGVKGFREIDASSSTSSIEIDASFARINESLTLTGGSGADKIFAGSGTDSLTGNGDADVFIFDSALNSNGTNTITDFTDGSDKIALAFDDSTSDSQGNTRTDGATLSDADFNNYVESWYTDNGDTLITLTGGDSITLIGVDASDITQADFAYHLVV